MSDPPARRPTLLFSLLYANLRAVLRLVVPASVLERSQEVELLVLRHELGILRRQLSRPRLRRRDRMFLAAASRLVERSSYARAFDEVFRAEGTKIIRTPVRASGERLRGALGETVRAECLDHMLILSRRHLDLVLSEYVEHYKTARPHRSLGLTTPEPRPPALARDSVPAVRCTERFGGLICEYEAVAA